MSDSSLGLIAIAASFIVAYSGYVVSHWYTLKLARRQDRLALLSAQLNEFYGPLYVHAKTSAAAFDAFKKKVEQLRAAGSQTPVRNSEWRNWMENVFLPQNQFLADVIRQNAHLIREKEMPECLLQFVAHHECSKAMVAKWDRDNFSDALPYVSFPRELRGYAERSYRELKDEQVLLIAKSHKGV